ncbi:MULTISPECIES: helix-turn-helix domain-containing protein [unclassified Streptomyces]|uniref:helix-turn-helix domain-containing protein n=1 Tax=unclassified Streptomyces TaxID=2593676 RepID=UPI0027956721|nr:MULTISPECIES: helix-turn-helix domain-containing protein [unclassified Streptomyces]
MTHIRQYQPDRYTIIGNHLAQHRELSLTAIGVGTHILSLPEGASVDIRTLAARFPEGRDRIAFALRELEAHGYVERVRERTADGRVITRTYAHNAPGGAETSVAEVPAAETAEVGDDALPPRVPAGPPVPAAPPQAPAPAAPPQAPAPAAEAPAGEHHAAAVALLAALRRTDDRLTLSRRDVRRLASAVAAWFENGATVAAVHRTLTADLPGDLQHPAGLLAHRLRELLPPPLPVGREVPPEGEAPPGLGAGDRRRPAPDPFQTCDGCERAFRARWPGRCRDCRGASVAGEPASGEPAGAAAAA